MDELGQLPELPEEPIITPNSPERFPILFSESQPCNIPPEDSDNIAIGEMSLLLDGLGDQAAGLAAVQIGYPKRIFLLRKNGANQVFINPTIVDQSNETVSKREGCLSLPHMEFRIKRPKSVTLRWFDEAGISHKGTFLNFWARAVMHEMDHLNGTILAEHEHSVLVDNVPRVYFKHQQGSIIRDAAFRKKVAKRRAKKKRAKSR